jgi:hypothetical protein
VLTPQSDGTTVSATAQWQMGQRDEARQAYNKGVSSQNFLDLQRIIKAWPLLPADLRWRVLAMIREAQT